MSSNVQVSSSTTNFQPIFDEALKEYKKKTGKELASHPLAEEIKSCDTPEAVLAVLQGKADELNQYRSGDGQLTKWLTPAVNVLNALSPTLGAGVGMVFPPTTIIFSGISILLVAARDTAASRDALIELFDKMENFFVRLKTYIEVPPTAEMTNVMGKIMAEVLSMLAIATKEMKQGRTKTFVKKLVGRTDIEDALQKLNNLEQGELRTVTAQVLRATSDIKDGVKRIEVIAQQIGTDVGAQDWKQLLRDLRGWLTPPDPSTNHNIMCSAQHERTSAWLFKEVLYEEWASKGSLLWIHGKPGSGKSVLCSAIIQHIIALRDAGLASIAYFYFDFRDTDKKHGHNLLCSLLIQLSAYSEPCCEKMYRIHSAYGHGTQQPSDDNLKNCLKEMLSVTSAQHPFYIILDAVDECPDTPGVPSPRQQVLSLVEDLVGLRLPNLHICVTSRPEIDICNTLGPLSSLHISLHDQPGQKKDITEFVNSIVHSDVKMKRWREDERKLVLETLSEKADGMFRWVVCQLETLRHCLAPSLRRQLNELPKSLDETYERILKEIESTNQGRHARRLLHCLAVALRPLDVEELAELLAFDLDMAEGEMPRFHAEWRWEDQEQAVLSACSSLISVVPQSGSRVVQFSHFSVKEYLTSDRLGTASGDILQYHIRPEPAHLIFAHACLGVLLSLNNRVSKSREYDSDEDGGTNRDKAVLLLGYAGQHWASHAQVGNVSSHLNDPMETLFDLEKPYFLAWLRTHDIDPAVLWYPYYRSQANPLYYAALCGFYDQVRRLIVKHPEQVNQDGGNHNSPLVAALSRNHVQVAELLLEYGAHVHVQGDPPLCRAITFSDDARVDAVHFLLSHGAEVNAGQENLLTPLHMATDVGHPEVVRILLEHGADVGLRDDKGRVPLHLVSTRTVASDKDEGDRYIVARLLVEGGADVNAQDMDGATPLHFVSCHGRLKITKFLLDHGANIHAENIQGRNPLHHLSRGTEVNIIDPSSGQLNGIHLQNVLSVAQLLLEHGVDVNAPDIDHATPLHLASSHGMPDIARLLLKHGAKTNAENLRGQTPLHLVSNSQEFSYESPNVARLLLEFGVDVNAQDKDQATPLHFACSHGNFETVLVLLDHGAEVNAQNADGQTPLHQVSQSSNFAQGDKPRIAEVMLERGADVNARDKDQATPLHLASYLSKPQTVRVLLDHGAAADAQNEEGQTPLHRVSQGASLYDDDDPRVARLLLERGVDVNARDKDQAIPLHLASFYGYANVAEVLFEHGARADAEDIRGQTPLHQVVLGIHDSFRIMMGISLRNSRLSRVVRLAQRLLERGADVDAQNKDQETPLHLASRLCLHEMARFLLEHGADVNVKNSKGESPLQLACGRKRRAMKRLLSGYSSKQNT